MKRFFWIIIALVLSILVMGIGGYMLIDLVTPRVGLCLVNGNSEMEEMLCSGLKRAGYTVLVENGENDQNLQVERLRRQGVKLLIVQPANPADTAAILEAAAEIPVLFMETEPENLGNGYFVGWNEEKLGYMQAMLLERWFTKADVNGDRYVDYMLISASDNEGYFRTAEETASAYKTVKLEEVVCDSTTDEVKAICKQAFSKYGRDLELIICDSSALALGAIEAIRENGRTPGRDVIVIGAGTEAECREAVRTGAMIAALVEDAEALSNQVIAAAKKLLGGREIGQTYYVDYKLLTNENVNP